MGQTQSVDPVHLRMYMNMIQIRDPIKRIQIIHTCFASMEYVTAAKRANIYSHLLHYISTVQHGGTMQLPGENEVTRNEVTRNEMTRNEMTRNEMTRPDQRSLHQSDQRSLQKPIQQQSSVLAIHNESTPAWKTVTETPQQKAISYFSSCLEVLGIQEEIALTEESLKKAYRKMSIKSHPDKPGGSTEYFEAVTRAYAYLSEILMVMQGGKRNTESKVDATAASQRKGTREEEAKQWEHVQPTRLDAKNLNMKAFNEMFEKTRIPDPDADGYGDWLKTDDGTTAPKFSEKFNRDVFNRMFDEQSQKSKRPANELVHPGQMSLVLNPTSGCELIAERPDSYTASTGSKFQYTDLRGAYTTESTVSDKVAHVHVANRNFDEYRASREKVPEALSQQEMHSIREYENRQKQMDSIRERKMAEMTVRNQQFHDRMKQLVITDATNLNPSR